MFYFGGRNGGVVAGPDGRPHCYELSLFRPEINRREYLIKTFSVFGEGRAGAEGKAQHAIRFLESGFFFFLKKDTK